MATPPPQSAASDMAAEGQPSRRDRIIRIAGLVLTVAAVAFIVAAFVANRSEIASLVADARVVPLALSLVPLLVSHVIAALTSQRVLAYHDAPRVPFWDLYAVLFGSNVAKYIPGGVWQIGSQYRLSRRAGIDSKMSVGLWVENALFTVTAGAFVSGAAFVFVADEYNLPWVLGLVPMAVAVVANVPRFRLGLLRLLRLSDRYRIAPGRGAHLLGAGMLAIGGALVLGLHGWLLGEALFPGGEIGFAAATLGLVGAWVVGFIVLPAPNGLGIREAALVALFAPWLSTGGAIALAAASRLVFLVADLIAGVVSGLVLVRGARRSGDES